MAALPETGKKAPAFKIAAGNGETVSLGDLKGQNVVLYFYPKDNTSGCTKEAIGFTEAAKDFKKLNAIVLGASKDSIKSHQRFIDKHGLRLTLLADEDGKLVEKYGVWVEKNNYGRKYMGIERATFLIDETGVVREIWRKVRVNGHVEAVQEALKALGS